MWVTLIHRQPTSASLRVSLEKEWQWASSLYRDLSTNILQVIYLCIYNNNNNAYTFNRINSFVLIGAVLRRLGVKGVEIRKPEHLNYVTSLIIPGGESTTMAKLAEFHNLVSFPIQFQYHICLIALFFSLYEKRSIFFFVIASWKMIRKIIFFYDKLEMTQGGSVIFWRDGLT